MPFLVVDTESLELACERTICRDETIPSANASFQTVDSHKVCNLSDSVSDKDSDGGDDIADDVLGPTVQVQLSHGNAKFEITPGPSDLSQSLDEGPKQFYMRYYPSHMIGTAQRRFNYTWFKLYSWLEYSKVNDSAYCFCCRHFGMTTRLDRRKDQVFIQSGFRAWNRCTGSDAKSNAFLLHMHSEEHRSSAEKYAAYQTMNASGKTVLDLLDSEHKKQVESLIILDDAIDHIRPICVSITNWCLTK